MSASETNGRTLPIFLIGGCKGGVGKSMVGEALVDDLLRRGARVLLVETDISVPDVWRAYEHMPGVEGLTLDLDDVDGWIVLGTTLSRHPGRVVVVNTAARNDRGIVSYGSMLTRALAKLRRPWSRSGDQPPAGQPGAAGRLPARHAGRPDPRDPQRSFRPDREVRAVQRLALPGADRGGRRAVADLPGPGRPGERRAALGRLAIARALDEREARIDFGSRIELERWREETRALFDEIVPPLEGRASGELGTSRAARPRRPPVEGTARWPPPPIKPHPRRLPHRPPGDPNPTKPPFADRGRWPNEARAGAVSRGPEHAAAAGRRRPVGALRRAGALLHPLRALSRDDPGGRQRAAGGVQDRTDQARAGAEQHLWNTAREQANATRLEMARAGEEAKTRLEQAIQQAARRIALEAGLAARWPWVFGGAAGMALGLALTGAVALGFGHQQGYHRGYVEGQRTATTAPPDRSSDRPPSPPARGR